MPKASKPAANRIAKPRLVAILAYEGVNAFELGMAAEIFSLSNLERKCYEVVVCSEQPNKPVSAGMVNIATTCGYEELRNADTVVIPGWQDIDAVPSPRLISELRRLHRSHRRLVSICSGVFLLASARLLDGRKAAVHWAQASILARRFPRVRVDDAVLYVDEDDILTSAGRAAGMDLCLHIIRKDFGGRLARSVAQRMVIPSYRDGGQSQYIPHSAQTQINELAELRAWVGNNIHRKLTLDEMAAFARMSRRTFIRRFEESMGLSPGEWLVRERVERARGLLEDTSMPIEHVATQVGFSSYEALRHHFRKRLQTSPVRYRSMFRSANTA